MFTTACFTVAACLLPLGDIPTTVDQTRQLFLDDFLIASQDGLTRCVHSARKYPDNPVLKPTEPWEGKVVLVFGSVIQEKDGYRVWYYAGGNVAYAHSKDGINWTKPNLDIIKVDGKNTNLLVLGDRRDRKGTIPFFYELFGVFRDDREPDPARRYKMGFLSIDREYKGPREGRFHGGQRRGLGVAVSQDGLHWKLLDNWATEAICDGATHWMFDPNTGKYVLFGRTKYIPPSLMNAWKPDEWVKRYFWGRAVARVESPDFVHWDITKPAKAPVVMNSDEKDPPGTEIYSMKVFPYESVYIGLLQVFHNQEDTCYLDVQLAVSRDGVKFQRVGDRQPFLPVGAVGSWDRFNQSLANNPPIMVDDTLRFYYGGRTYRHSPYQGDDKGEPGGAIGLATVRRDRFVSLGASFDGGQLTTRPLKLNGKNLHLNAKAAFGKIIVEALDSKGDIIARSEPICEDTLDIPVQWKKTNPRVFKEPVALRITLRNALLYSLWCS
ncbi:MAG: hypothetical protein JXM70_23460 [Pirellulales bacterium]|nr:hypothetical protein [Pirellulales bacterium]